MTDPITLPLIVQEADSSDVGRGYARINNDVMAKLGVDSGDFVKITGKRTGVAKVMRSSVSGSGGIAIDGDTRRAAGAGIGDTVMVEKTEPQTASKITIQPASQSIKLDSRQLEQFIVQQYAGKPVAKGQVIQIPLATQTRNEDPFFSGWGGFSSYSTEYYAFVISDVSPGDIAIIGSQTSVHYKDSVYKGEDAPKGKSAGNTVWDVNFPRSGR